MYSFRNYCDSPQISKRILSDESDVRFGDIIIRGEDAFNSVCDVAILGVPQDIGVSRNGGRTGAALAPDAIRMALYKLSVSNGRSSISKTTRITDFGNIKCDGKSLEQIHDLQKSIVVELLSSGAFVIVFGGGHDIAYPNGSALASVSESIGIINIDAHTDVRPMIKEGDDKLAHSGSPFRQLIEDEKVYILPGCFIEFGIQSFAAAEKHIAYVEDSGYEVKMLEEITILGSTNSFEKSLQKVSSAESVYCSFDIDGIASCYAPGVSAPSVDGFSPSEIFSFAKAAASNPKCRLIDIVELNPKYDVDNHTAKLSASIVACCIWSRSQKW